MKSKWKTSRSATAGPDGRSRWDHAFQFLLDSAREAEAGREKTENSNNRENDNENSSICSCIDGQPAAKADD